MIKAIFMDYTGTIIQEKGADLEKIVSRIWKNSRLETVEETVRYWWSQLKTMEEKSYDDAFLTEDEIVDCLLERLGREECLEQNGLTAAGIILGEMVRAYKPHKEAFDYALKISGCAAGEVIHIGDSVVSDVNGASAAGITPVLIDRKAEVQSADYKVIHRLTEVFKYLECI